MVQNFLKIDKLYCYSYVQDKLWQISYSQRYQLLLLKISRNGLKFPKNWYEHDILWHVSW